MSKLAIAVVYADQSTKKYLSAASSTVNIVTLHTFLHEAAAG